MNRSPDVQRLRRAAPASAIIALLALAPATLAQPAGDVTGAPLSPAPAPARAPAATPTPTPAPVLPRTLQAQDARFTTILIIAVQGSVQYRSAPDAPWKPAAVGAMLTEGGSIRTLPNSAVQIRVGLGQVFTIDRMGTVNVLRAIREGQAERTSLGIDYGRVLFEVTDAGVANDVKLVAPDATLAVKGTIGGMEVTPGQPTRAFGGPLNTGTFTVTYPSGVAATVTRQSRTRADLPLPAEVARIDTFVDTGPVNAREDEEVAVVLRSPGSSTPGARPGRIRTDVGPPGQQIPDRPRPPNGGDDGGGNDGGGAIPPDDGNEPPDDGNGGGDPPDDGGNIPPDDGGEPVGPTAFYLDLNEDSLRERDRLGNDALRRENIAADFELFQAGLATLVDPRSGQRLLVEVRLVSQGDIIPYYRVAALDLDDPQSTLTETGRIDLVENPIFYEGLGAIEGNLYAVGRDLDEDRLGIVDRINLGGGSPERLMESPFFFIGGAAGTPRGTLLAVANEPFERGADFDGADAAIAILELDPRSNALINAWTELDGDLRSSPDTITTPDGLATADIALVTGLAEVDGRIVAGVILGGDDPERIGQAFLVFNPNATDAPGDPRLERIDLRPAALVDGLASETGGPVPGPIVLAEPSGPIDTRGIAVLFAEMGYTSTALRSGFVERSIAQAILDSAADPEGCAASGALSRLSSIIPQFADQRAGVGQSVAAFRAELPPAHPCLPPGGD